MPLPLAPLAPDATAIFMHIEHTGGSTLRDIIKRQYAQNEILGINRRKSVDWFNARSEADRRRCRFVIGHMCYGLHRHITGPSRYVTVLRHPIERMLSSYTYIQRTDKASLGVSYRSFSVSWQEHLDNRGDHRRQIGRITGGTDAEINARVETVPAGDLDTAIAHLESDFAMVGLQERFDESLLMMKYVLNWQKPLRYIRQNVTSKPIKLADLSASDRALLEKAAEIEMPLYEYALKRFEAQVAAYPGDLERDLAQFRAQNRRYAKLHPYMKRIREIGRKVRRRLPPIFRR